MRVARSLVIVGLGMSSTASAGDNPPRAGGHFGVAVPIVSVAGGDTSVIGSDHGSVGLAPGVTIHVTDKVAVDYEMVAYTNFKGTGNTTVLVVDPGVVYNFGPLAAGLRGAVRLADQTNVGLIPIVNKGFPVGDVAWFVELDLPVFFNETTDATSGDTSTVTAFTAQLQTGFGF